MGQVEGAVGAHSWYQTQTCFRSVGSREGCSGEVPLKQIPKDELARVEERKKRGFQAERPAEVRLV